MSKISHGSREPVERVEFGDGSCIVVGKLHHWRTLTFADRSRISRNDGRPQLRTLTFLPFTTEELRQSLKHHSGKQETSTHSVPLAHALTLPEQNLAVPPYVLGMWLGDGKANEVVIICSAHDEPHYKEKIKGLGENWRIRNTVEETVCCSLAGEPDPGLRTRLRQLGVLNNKHVPAAHLRESQSQRLELLKGLMDSDSHIYAEGNAEFTSTSEALAQGAMEIILSLGMKPTTKKSDSPKHKTRGCRQNK